MFTYVRKDFIDGREYVRRRVVVQSASGNGGRCGSSASIPRGIAGFVGEYGWRLIEQAGPDYYLQHYIGPAGRDLAASDLEWTAYARVSPIREDFSPARSPRSR